MAKKNESSPSVHLSEKAKQSQRIQTAEGWKRSQIKKNKPTKMPTKKSA